jgi:hypothetical protein
MTFANVPQFAISALAAILAATISISAAVGPVSQFV